MAFFAALLGVIAGSSILRFLVRYIPGRVAGQTGSCGCGCLTLIILLVVIALVCL
jgi:hypothetical protein